MLLTMKWKMQKKGKVIRQLDNIVCTLVWACGIILEGVSDSHSKTIHEEEKLENIMEKWLFSLFHSSPFSPLWNCFCSGFKLQSLLLNLLNPSYKCMYVSIGHIPGSSGFLKYRTSTNIYWSFSMGQNCPRGCEPKGKHPWPYGVHSFIGGGRKQTINYISKALNLSSK